MTHSRQNESHWYGQRHKLLMANRMYASGVLAGGNNDYTNRQNGAFFVRADPEYQLMAHNRIESDDSVFNATPAIGNNSLFLRSNTHLYRIASDR